MHIAGFVNGRRVNFPRLTLSCRVISEGSTQDLEKGQSWKHWLICAWERVRGAPHVIGKLPQNKRGRDCADDAGRVNQRRNVKAC